LFIITWPNVVDGVPIVFVMLAEFEPKKVTGIFVNRHHALVPAGAFISPFALLIRLPPIEML
jgi:hypothetical protein